MYVPVREGSNNMRLDDRKIISEYKVIDLFAGAGGLSNGFEQTGRFKVVGAAEINKAAVQTYIKNHNNDKDIIITPENHSESDITKINFKKFIERKNICSDEVVVIGGPPCQGFSNANRQKNYLISGNNQLVKEYVRAIEEIRPAAFVMENVKTMDSDIHKFFVTHDNCSSIYGSYKYITEVLHFHNESPNDFFKNESLVLVETSNTELGPIFENLIELGLNESVKRSILNPGNLLSRLKSIFKISKKLEEVHVIKQKEIKEIKQIISHLENLSNELTIVNSLIQKCIETLNKILITSVPREEIKVNIGRILDLNQFLIHYKEILDGHIFLNNELTVSTSSTSKIQVIANVKSYNVVKYLKKVFSFLGYYTDDRVLTASDYGVPQRRKRYIVLGVKKELSEESKVELPKKIFDEPYTTYHAISDLETVPPQNDLLDYNPIPYSFIINKNLNPLQKYFRDGNVKSVLMNHINTKSRDLSLKRFEAIKNLDGKNFHSLTDELKTTYTDTSRTQNTIYLRLNYEEPAPTVVNVRKSMWNHPKNAVSLSIREAARLQSFKDNFTFYGTKDQQYQQIGNAVPPLMARAVAERLLTILGITPQHTIKDEFQ